MSNELGAAHSVFDLLSIDPAFQLDWERVNSHYAILQESLHPDRYPKGAPEIEIAGELLQRINHAYGVLKDPVLRARALLEHLKITVPGDHGTSVTSPDLMMEALEIKESVADADDLKVLMESLTARQNEIETLFDQCFAVKDHLGMQTHYVRLSFVNKTINDIKKNAAANH